MPPRDFPSGNFWRLIGENEARKKVKKWEMLRKRGKMENRRMKIRKKIEKIKKEG